MLKLSGTLTTGAAGWRSIVVAMSQVYCESPPPSGEASNHPPRLQGRARGLYRSPPFLPIFGMWLRSRLTGSPPFWPAWRASAGANSGAVPCLWAARPPSAAIARCRWSLIPAKPLKLPRARRKRVVDDLPDLVGPGFFLVFFELARLVLVSPFSRRILLTVRAATSSARRP